MNDTTDPRSTVFLVDDNSEMRQSLKWLLESHGYRVVASGSTAEALENYDPLRPGCLVLDVRLPDASGIDLYKQFRERGGMHPFIVITAYGRVPIAVEAMRLGAIDFLEKPFNHSVLLERVREAVAKDVRARQTGDENKSLIKRLRVLARREWQVAELVAAGKSSKDIAAALGIKLKTVEVHRHNIIRKLRAESSAEVAALVTKAQALKGLGLFDLPE